MLKEKYLKKYILQWHQWLSLRKECCKIALQERNGSGSEMGTIGLQPWEFPEFEICPICWGLLEREERSGPLQIGRQQI